MHVSDLMRIRVLGQKSTHIDHNHQVLLGIATSLVRCMGTTLVNQATNLVIQATNLAWVKLQ